MFPNRHKRTLQAHWIVEDEHTAVAPRSRRKRENVKFREYAEEIWAYNEWKWTTTTQQQQQRFQFGCRTKGAHTTSNSILNLRPLIVCVENKNSLSIVHWNRTLHMVTHTRSCVFCEKKWSRKQSTLTHIHTVPVHNYSIWIWIHTWIAWNEIGAESVYLEKNQRDISVAFHSNAWRFTKTAPCKCLMRFATELNRMWVGDLKKTKKRHNTLLLTIS